MNYVTTNIRLSEDDYIRLKTEAAKKRKSLSAIIREKLQSDLAPRSKVETIINDLKILARENGKKLKDIDGTLLIRQIRDKAKW